VPELPEVETTRRGLEPHLAGCWITKVDIRQPSLRWPVSAEVGDLVGRRILTVRRRAKYLLIGLEEGHLIIHLGMSGSMRIIAPEVALRKHDHVTFDLSSGQQLRFHDPRRFGCILYHPTDPLGHPLLRALGPEPLNPEFDATSFQRAIKGRASAIKLHLMNQAVVVGVGNIYACEALFRAGIRPGAPAGKVSLPRLRKLVDAVKEILARSITQGGTTLRDFLREDGTAGYFKQSLEVYDREGEPCKACGTTIRREVLGQRATFYCPRCQR
jgi:formamidopyrimidine-DNA glycosylase